MSSKPKVEKTETTSKTGPLAEQQPVWSDIWSRTGQALGATNNQPFLGDFVAAPTVGQRTGVGMLYDAAGNVGTAGLDLTGAAKKLASGYFLDPNNDPTFAAAASAAIDPVRQQLMEQVLPGIIDKSIQAGGAGNGPAAYGGADQGIKQGQAIDAFNKTALNTTATMANATRSDALKLMPQAAGLSQAGDTAALLPAMTTGQAGETERGLDQLVLDNLLAKYQNEMSAPFFGLSDAAQIMATGGFNTSDGTKTVTGSAPSLATQWLQGLTGGASMVNSLFGAPAGGTSAMAGLGSTLGSVGSWLGSLMTPGPLNLLAFSDRRLKADIAPVGTTYDGQTLYRYRYLADPEGTIRIGLMADEVEPRWVGVDPHGFQHVNYAGALGLATELGKEKETDHG